MISPSRLDDDSTNVYGITFTFLPEIHRQSLVRCPVFFLVRFLVSPSPYRVAPATGESIGAHICPIPSTLAMPSHATSCTPIPPWSSSQCRNTPSTNQLHVFAFQVGRSVWLHKRYCLKTFFPISSGRVGTLGIYSILITNRHDSFVWIP